MIFEREDDVAEEDIEVDTDSGNGYRYFIGGSIYAKEKLARTRGFASNQGKVTYGAAEDSQNESESSDRDVRKPLLPKTKSG